MSEHIIALRERWGVIHRTCEQYAQNNDDSHVAKLRREQRALEAAIAALSAEGGAVAPLGYLRAFDAQYLERKISGQCQVIVYQTPPRKNAVPLYTRPAAAATGDMVLVPREMTDAMREAAMLGHDDVDDAWAAMIAAAQQEPQ